MQGVIKMTDKLKDVLMRIAGVVCTVLVGVVVYLYIVNLRLESKVSGLESDLVVCKTNNVATKSALDRQNEKITSMEIDLEERTKKYQELLNQPPKIRYKTVYEKVPNIEVKSDECEEIKKLIDGISAAGY